MATKAGYGKVCHISEDFEGDLDENRYRSVRSWKKSLPFTLKVDPRMSYRKSAAR